MVSPTGSQTRRALELAAEVLGHETQRSVGARRRLDGTRRRYGRRFTSARPQASAPPRLAAGISGSGGLPQRPQRSAVTRSIRPRWLRAWASPGRCSEAEGGPAGRGARCQRRVRSGPDSGLGLYGVDVVIPASERPLVLEVNARPGLEIHNVTGLGLDAAIARVSAGEPPAAPKPAPRPT